MMSRKERKDVKGEVTVSCSNIFLCDLCVLCG
jgi:hypothetical protein